MSVLRKAEKVGLLMVAKKRGQMALRDNGKIVYS
jgi:hypothetical protein